MNKYGRGGINNFNDYDNRISQIYSITPVQTSVDFNPFNPNKNSHKSLLIIHCAKVLIGTFILKCKQKTKSFI